MNVRPVDTGPAYPVPRTAMQARDRVQSLIESSGILPETSGPPGEDVLSDALLVTSELATNAIRHGGGIVGFSASVSSDGLLLAVADASGDHPVTLVRPPGTFPVGGFGWPLICRLARSVRILPAQPVGKRIEVLVPLDGADSPPVRVPDQR
ncbi:ATP-binding protein [Streptomyces sp. H27-S2]|uniref:ATP-binding protein n=1 Tax=Streptomyces antarcticus TaxID=2996458 RepID=UPI00226D82D5|nr:ATP-binding protein [Streptomyces sp. H27-S2]MCY0953325.1 ATP-binding protein [Streptomyces sp. H27-S2]